MRTRRHDMKALVVFLLLPTLASCEVDPEDPLFLAGTAMLPDGGTAAGAPLTLERSLGPAPHLLPSSERPLGEVPMETLQTVVSREDGHWRAEVLSFDSITSWRSAPIGRLMRVGHNAREDLGSARVSFVLGDDDAELPPLQQWNDSLQVSPEGSDTLKFLFQTLPPPVPPSPLQPGDYQPPGPSKATLLLEDATGVAFRVPDVQPALPYTLPAPEWLEDFELKAHVVVRTPGTWFYDSLLKGPTGGSIDYVLERSLAAVPLPKGDIRPFSRGALCPAIAPEGPCPLTDGNLEPVRIPHGAAIELKLREPQTIQSMLLLFRGLRAPDVKEIPLYVQFEGEEQWTGRAVPFGNSVEYDPEEEEFFIGGLPFGSVRRIVSIRLAAPGAPPPSVLSLRELSAFAYCYPGLGPCP